jgi:hypothetical protein
MFDNLDATTESGLGSLHFQTLSLCSNNRRTEDGGYVKRVLNSVPLRVEFYSNKILYYEIGFVEVKHRGLMIIPPVTG